MTYEPWPDAEPLTVEVLPPCVSAEGAEGEHEMLWACDEHGMEQP